MGTTVTTELVTEGETRGRKGRRFVSAERRRELIAAFGGSGLTRAEFARREGLKYTTLCNWVQRGATAGGDRARATAPATLRFAEVALPPPGSAHSLEVRLPDGTSVRGERVGELVALVRALRA